MGASKTALFTSGQNEIAALLKAMAHPARIAILEYLIQVDSCVCGELVDVLPLAQPTVSQHLKELKQVGLIKGNIEGTSVCYCIDKQNFARVKAYFSNIDLQSNPQNDNCCS